MMPAAPSVAVMTVGMLPTPPRMGCAARQTCASSFPPPSSLAVRRRSPAREPHRSSARTERRSPDRDHRSPARRASPRDHPRWPVEEQWRSSQRHSPSPPQCRSCSPTPPGLQQQQFGTSQATRRYQAPQNQPSFPPANGGNGNRGRQGAKKKKKKGPARPPAPATSTASAPPVDTGAPRDSPPCFNCGLIGHFQVACPNPPMCYLCKDSGHPAVLARIGR
nr:serine/arginine repetitive matrix protein 1-like [Aegilops tauschii subsp. strangulata]